MSFVVAEPCFGCKNTACVTVCPCDCFHEGDQMLYIDPNPCIDCGACAEECPTGAIFQQDEVPVHWSEYIALNAEMAEICPSITQQKKPLKC